MDIQVSVSNYLQSVAMTILVQTSKRVSLKILHLGSSWLEGNVYLEFWQVLAKLSFSVTPI